MAVNTDRLAMPIYSPLYLFLNTIPTIKISNMAEAMISSGKMKEKLVKLIPVLTSMLSTESGIGVQMKNRFERL